MTTESIWFGGGMMDDTPLNHSQLFQHNMTTTAQFTTDHTLDNTTGHDILNGYPYPSQYSWPRIILTSIVVTFIIIIIILGNGLVILAIAKDNNLKGINYWFIASLAVSDLLLGLLIMPWSLANEVMGYWIFGKTLCQMWLSIDVLLCTASILNLCLISIDRYWSITRAVSYVRSRTKRKGIIMITIVWILSGIICFPPLVGWKRPQTKKLGYPLCLLSQEKGYVAYSTVGSFFAPLIVMLIVYLKIYVAARKRARRNLKKKSIVPPHGKQSTSTSSTAKDNHHHSQYHSPKFKNSIEKLQPIISDSEYATLQTADTDGEAGSVVPQVVGSGNDSTTAVSDSYNTDQGGVKRGIKMTVINHRPQEGPKTPVSYLDEKRNLLCEDTDCTESEAVDNNHPPGEQFPNYSVPGTDVPDSGENRKFNVKHNGYNQLNTNPSHTDDEFAEHKLIQDSDSNKQCCLQKKRTNDHSVPKLTIMRSPASPLNEEYDRELDRKCKSPSPDFGEIGSPDSKKDLLSPNCHPPVISTFKIPTTKSKKRAKDRKALDDPDRLKRKIARAKERRATLVLGVIMATFILCWLPFFGTYFISTLAGFEVPDLAFNIMFWAGYCNSALNPIIYTIFNKDFRQAFERIIFGRRWGGYY